MKLELRMAEDFGTSLADGSRAMEYRVGHIDPYIGLCQEIVLDFTGVRIANSSFMNALVCGLIEQHGQDVLGILTFKACNPVLRVLVESAIDLGLSKISGKVDA